MFQEATPNVRGVVFGGVICNAGGVSEREVIFATLAARQHGVFSVGQATELGFGPFARDYKDMTLFEAWAADPNPGNAKKLTNQIETFASQTDALAPNEIADAVTRDRVPT